MAVVMAATLLAAGLWMTAGPPTSQAYAQPQPQPGGGNPHEIVEAGRRAYNLGRWEEAIDAFERSYQLTGDPALLFNLAQSHRQLDHVVEALRLYKTYLRERPNGPDRRVAEEQIVELERRRRTAPPMAPAPAATTAPRPGTLPPASPVAPAAPLGPTAGAPAPVISPLPSPAPVPSVTAAVPAATPSAEVPTPPPMTTTATTGTAALAVAAPANAGAGRAGPPLPRWLPWAGAAVTATLATAAAVIGLASNERFDSLASSCGQTQAGCSEHDIASVRSDTRTANLLWIGAGVMAAATGVGVYVNTREAGVSGLVRF